MVKWLENWLEKLITRSIISSLDERKNLFRTGHTVLSREHPNIIDIPVGQAPRAKAEQIIKDQMKIFKFLTDDGYIILFRAVKE